MCETPERTLMKYMTRKNKIKNDKRQKAIEKINSKTVE